VTTDASLGPVFLHDDNRKVALIAPTDINSPEERRVEKYVIVYHPGYRRGDDPVEFPYVDRCGMKPVPTDNHQSQLSDPKLSIYQDDNYIDPVSSVAPEYGGRWILGCAPVGNTGFGVVVQQRFEDAVNLGSSTLWNLVLWSALASLVALAIMLIALWRWTKSRRLESGMIAK